MTSTTLENAEPFFRGHEYLDTASAIQFISKDQQQLPMPSYPSHPLLPHAADFDPALMAADEPPGEAELRSLLSEFLLPEDFGTTASLPEVFVQEPPQAAPTGQIASGKAEWAPAPHSPASSSTSSDNSASDPRLLPQSAAAPLDRKAKRRQQVAISARRHRSRKKHELMDLRDEVGQLTAQLTALRSRHRMLRPHGAVAEWEERAMAQRRKRRQAEDIHAELRRAIFEQSQFLSNLRGLFTASPLFTEDLNLRQLLHTYTRLGRNPRSRQREYEAICTDAKLHMAMDILRRQTDDIPFTGEPYVRTQLLESNGLFGATIVSVYAFETRDIRKVFVAACGAVRDSNNVWPEFAFVDGGRETVDTVGAGNISYAKQTVRLKSEIPSEEVNKNTNQDEVLVESRVISHWRLTDSEAMFVWDYVDDDDLHPINSNADLRRDTVGAFLVRLELCDDGKERVVCRAISTKLHAKTQSSQVQPLSCGTSIVDKFASAPKRDDTRMCGKVVYSLIQQATANPSLS